MPKFFNNVPRIEGDNPIINKKPRFFGNSQMTIPEPVRFEGVDVGQYGDLVKNSNGLIFDPIQNLENIAAQNQSGLTQMGLAVPRLIGGTVMKGLEGVGLIGSALGSLGYNAGVLASNNLLDTNADYLGLDDVTNNPITNTLFKMEEGMKDYLKVYKPSDWEDKDIIQQLGSTAWWADEGMDALAFALSNIIPAVGLGKLGLGMKAVRGMGAGVNATDEAVGLTGFFGAAERAGESLGKMGKLGQYANSILLGKTGLSNPLKFASTVDNATQLAYMTGSEALFEAKDTGDGIKNSILQEYNQKYGQEIESYEELPVEIIEANKERVGTGMQEAFFANLATLTFSNYIEIGLINKLFRTSTKAGLSGQIDIGKETGDIAKRIERKGVDKFLNRKIPSIVNAGLKQAAIEGLIEENVQHSIQKISDGFGHTGAIDYLFDLGNEIAESMDDKETWKAIVPGMLLGFGMGGVSANSEFNNQEKAIASTLDKLSKTRENFINLKNNLYMKDDKGNTILDENGNGTYNEEFLAQFKANQNQVGDLAVLHDLYKEQSNEVIANALKEEAITKYALAHLEAGLGDELTAKVKNLASYKEEDLAEKGKDPIEIGKNGERITPQQRAQEVEAIVQQVRKDYDLVTKVVPEGSPRANEATKVISRVRSLQRAQGKLNQEAAQLRSRLDGQNTTVEQINSLTRQVQNLRNNLPIVESFRNEVSGEAYLANYMKEIKLKEDALIAIKASNVENLTGQGYVMPEDIEEIETKERQLPEYQELIEKERKLVETELAKDTQLDRFNKLTDLTTGEQFFNEEKVGKLRQLLEDAVASQKEAEDLSIYEDGQALIWEDETGTKVQYIKTNEKGQLMLGNKILNQALLDKYPGIRIMTEEEVEEFISKGKLSIRKRQTQEKIDYRKGMIERNLEVIRKATEKVIEAELTLEDLQYALNTGKVRMSQKTLDKKIKAYEKLVAETEAFIEEIEEVNSNTQKQIDTLQERLDNKVDLDIAFVENQLEELEQRFVDNEVELQTQYKILNKLKDYLKFLKELWVKAFPDKKRVLNNQPQTEEDYNKAIEYTSALEEIALTKAEIAQTEDVVRTLEANSERIQKRMDTLRKEINEYEAQVKRLTYTKPVKPEQKEGKDNLPSINSIDMFNEGLTPDISKGLFKTAGSEKSTTPSQKRWFKFTERYNPKLKYRLRTVKTNDPIYGVGKEKDIFKEDDKKYQTEDNIKVLVVDKKGNPIEEDGLIYTSLVEIREDQTELEHFQYQDGTPMFENRSNLKEEKVSSIIEEYRKEINVIKNSNKPIYFDIDGKSNGLMVQSPEIAAEDAFTSAPEIQIITDEVTTFSGSDFKVPKGMVYVNYNGRPVPATVRNITPVEAPEILKLLKKYASLRNEAGGKAVMEKILSIVFLGESKTHPEFSMFFVKNDDSFMFQENLISLEDLISGKYDSQIIDQLLGMNHQVHRKTLENKEPYIDIFGKEFPSYQEYLLAKRDTLAEVPLTFAIPPTSQERQFMGVYLRYGTPKSTTKEKGKQKKASRKEADEAKGEVIRTRRASDILEEEDSLTLGKKKNKKDPDLGEDLDELMQRLYGDNYKSPTTTDDEVGGTDGTKAKTGKSGKGNKKGNVKKSSSESSSEELSEEEYEDRFGGMESLGFSQVSDSDMRDIGNQQSSSFNNDDIDDFDIADNTSTGETEDDFGFSQVGEDTSILDSLRDEPPFLLKERVKNYTQADVDAEIAEVKRLLGNSAHAVKIHGLIKSKAFGQLLLDGTILISDLATVGTAYHEVFHRVSLMLLTKAEREGIYSEWRQANPERKDLSDRQVEEELAEEFREHMLTNPKPSNKRESMFQKMIDFIKAVLGIKRTTLDNIFEKISDGKFANRPIRERASYSPFSISKEFSKTTEKDLFDSMTFLFLRGLSLNNFTAADITKANRGLLSDEDTKRLNSIYKGVFDSMLASMKDNAERQSNKDYILEELIPYIKENKVKIAKEHQAYLSKFNINLGDEIELEEDEKSPEAITKDSLGINNAMEQSARMSMPSSIRLLIASLPRYENEEIYYNNLGLPTLSNYKKNTAILHNSLAGLSSFSAQVEKIREMVGKGYPEFKYLLHGLGVSPGTVTPSTLSNDKFDLQMQFRQQFDKSYYTFYLHLYDGDNSFIMDANSGTLTEIIKTKWANSLSKNEKALKYVNGQPLVNIEYFNKKYPSDKVLNASERRESTLSFFKDLGIEFSKPDLVDIDLLSDKQKVIAKRLNNVPISDIFQDELEVKGWINELIFQELSTSLDFSDNQHINPEGKTVYNVSLNNYLSIITNELAQGNVPEHLKWDEKTQTGNPLMRNSLWIKKAKQLKVVILEGSTIKRTGETGESTANLSRPEAALQQFTSVMKGIFPFFRAGDKRLEHAFEIGKPLRHDLKQMIDTYKGYLKDEMLSAWMLNVEKVGADLANYKDKGKDLRVFKGIFNKKEEKLYQSIINSGSGNERITRETAIKQIDNFVDRRNEPAVREALQKWFDKKVQEDINELIETGLVSKDGSIFVLEGIPKEIYNDFDFTSPRLTKVQMKGFMEIFSHNYRVANIEQIKMFTGDLAFYSDFFKRTGGLTGTGKTHATGQEVDAWLNENFKREYRDKEGKLKIDKKSDGRIRSWVFNDVRAKATNFESWVQGLINQGFTEKEARARLNDYVKKEGYEETDGQGWITMPEYREMKKRNSSWSDSHEVTYQKMIAGETVSRKELIAFQPEKPQNYSPQEYDELYMPTYYKYSVMPLIPQVVKGTQLEDLMFHMLANGVGITTFSSANKVGRKETTSFYKDGKINTEDKEPQITDYKYMKIQLDVSPEKKNKVIFGTQFRKIILGNLIGRELTINGKKIKGKDIVNKFNRLVNEATKLERVALEEQLGFERKDNGTYILKSPTKLRNLLVEETFKRDAPDNVRNGIVQILDEWDSKYFEVSVNRNKVEAILLSLVNNRVIKQKVLGDMKVQAAPTGFETKPRKQSDVEDSWASGFDTLKFYEYDDKGTIAMEILVPHFFKEMLGRDIDIKKVDPRLLEIIGFRIPTQGLNSIEVIKIKGFLPEAAGSTVIVPSEGVVKSGWDFDVDKLTLFFPNYTWNKETNMPEYVVPDETTLKGIQNNIIRLSRRIASAPENFATLITPNSAAIIKEIATEMNGIKPRPYSIEDQSTYIDWSKNLEVREANLSGLAGIGQTALHNVHHILGQIVGLKISNDKTVIHLEHNNTVKETTNESKKTSNVIPVSNFSRNSVAQDSKYIYLFTDNARRNSGSGVVSKDSWYAKKYGNATYPTMTQAVIRGLNNAFPITTMVNDSRTQWTDDRIEEYKKIINDEVSTISEALKSGEFLGIKFSNGNPFGLGKISAMKTSAPKTWEYLNKKLKEIGIDNTGEKPVSIEKEVKEVKENGAIDLSQIYSADYNGEIDAPTILDIISAFINGFVDVAKDPFMKQINATNETNGTYFYLIRSGVPVRQAIMFMNQPIITKYLDELKKSQAMHMKSTETDLKATEVQRMVRQLFEKDAEALDLNDEATLRDYKKAISTENLKKYIAGDIVNNSVQQQILTDFLNYKEAGQKLSKLIKATTADTSGTGGSLTYAQDVVDRLNDILREGYFTNVNKFVTETFIGGFLQAVSNATKMYQPIFYTEKPDIKLVLREIKRVLKLNPNIGIEDMEPVLNMAKNDLVSYIVQMTKTRDGGKFGSAMKELFIGQNSLPNRIATIKANPNKSKLTQVLDRNLLIRELYPILGKTETDVDNLKFFNKRLPTEDSNLITEAWQELFDIAYANNELNDVEVANAADIASDLITFAIFQSGLNNSPISFLQYAPNEHYIPFVTALLNKFDRVGDLSLFKNLFIKNRYQNNNLVPKTSTSYMGQSNMDSEGNLLVSWDAIKQYPYVKTWNQKKKSFDLWQNTNVTTKGGKQVFKRSGKLGDGNNFTEYWTLDSMVLDNRVEIKRKNTTKKGTELDKVKGSYLDDTNMEIC